ncbi:MAG: DeoR/GlpR transcriptional regulator [Anaerolineae bacterium]|nr:DeoR/GlpR transcriptional regulator [Anaerolineae bacterium]
MLAAERHQTITQLLRQQSTVHIDELIARLGVSESTVRRDLEHLEQQGILKRTYGGAVAIQPGFDTLQIGFFALSAAQMRIGAAAAQQIGDGETVFLGPGAISLAVAHHLDGKLACTVVTNCLNIATCLARQAQQNVILTGGQIDRPDLSLVGHLAEASLRELRADKAIIGVRGLHLPDGLTATSLPAVQVLRTAIEMVSEVIIVLEASQWGSRGPAFLAPLEAIDIVVTDQDAPPAMVWDLVQLGIRVIQS